MSWCLQVELIVRTEIKNCRPKNYTSHHMVHHTVIRKKTNGNKTHPISSILYYKFVAGVNPIWGLLKSTQWQYTLMCILY